MSDTPIGFTSQPIGPLVQVVNTVTGALATGTTAALFQDTTANALAANISLSGATAAFMTVPLNYTMTAGTTSATTFKVRCGTNNVGTTSFNGSNGSRFYGGTLASSITIWEYRP